MPATKLCEDGADMLMVLYDGEKDVENEPFEASFPLFEGGFITVTFYSGNSNGFDNEQRNIVEIIANTVFIQFNRVVMQELVTHVIKTDIETGAATLDALINYAGMLIAQNRIEDFSIIFFNIHNFKYVNKVLNYEQGDVVLRNYTKTIYRNLSDGCTKIKSFDTLPSSYLMFIKLSISIYSLSDSFFTSITKLSPPSLVIISPSERFRIWTNAVPR